MKTSTGAQLKINSLDDIVFVNRNRNYGAYELRNKYKKHLLVSILITSGFCLLFIIFFVVFLNHNIVKPFDSLTTQVVLESPMIVPPPEISPPSINQGCIPPSPQNSFNLDLWQSCVVDSIQTFDLLLSEDPINSISLDSLAMFVDEVQPAIIEAPEHALNEVTDPATFEGGNINSFYKWVRDHLKYTKESAKLQLQGRLVIQFIVNEKGVVENVKVIRGVDPLLDKLSVNVIQKSPKWQPAKIKGQLVRQKFVIPIIFKLQNT